MVTMESIKAICTPDYVLVFNPEDRTVMPFVELLIKALKPAAPILFPAKAEKRVRVDVCIASIVIVFILLCVLMLCLFLCSVYC